jgi:hypothetical protein
MTMAMTIYITINALLYIILGYDIEKKKRIHKELPKRHIKNVI